MGGNFSGEKSDFQVLPAEARRYVDSAWLDIFAAVLSSDRGGVLHEIFEQLPEIRVPVPENWRYFIPRIFMSLVHTVLQDWQTVYERVNNRAGNNFQHVPFAEHLR